MRTTPEMTNASSSKVDSEVEYILSTVLLEEAVSICTLHKIYNALAQDEIHNMR